MRNRGFTLIELTVVIVIMGIIATMAAPNISGMFTSSQVRMEAQMLTLTIKNIQGHAALQRTPYILTLDLTNQSYRASKGASTYNDFPLELADLTGSGVNMLGESYSSADQETFTEHPEIYEYEYAAFTNLRTSVPMRQTRRAMPDSVRMITVIDDLGEEYMEGRYTISFDAKGNVEPCTVIFAATRNPNIRYFVELGFNGRARYWREDLQ